MIEVEPSVNWGEDPWGRRQQLRREFDKLEVEGNRIGSAWIEKQQAIVVIQDGDTQGIKGAAEKAYRELENVVSVLLTIEDGRRRLSRESSAILETLQTSVNSFEELTTKVKLATDHLGINAGDCMALRDEATTFVAAIESRITGANQDIAAIWRTKKGCQDQLDETAGKKQHLNERLQAARDNDNFGNDVLNFFGGDSDRGARDIREAEQRVRDNDAEQDRIRARIESFYQLYMTTRNATSAMLCLQDRIGVNVISFADEFKSLTDTQMIESDLEKGLRDLRNKIWSTDYLSTRDNSLKVLLELLIADDEVFHRQDFYEDTQKRIEDAISAKLGSDSLKQLMAPLPPETSIAEFELP